MPNPYKNKIVYNGTTLIDLTGVTVAPSVLAEGYTALDASGAPIVGTMSGGGGSGAVWQDAQGYVHLSDEEGGSGSGLQYETGTWTPTEDVTTHEIQLANTHVEAPFYFLISDITGTYSDVNSSTYLVQYVNFHQLYGVMHYIGETSSNYSYGIVNTRYRASATTFSNSTGSINQPYTNTADSSVGDSRYWATESMIKAYTNSTSRYFRSGRTYKWIAVWKPTS